MRRAVVLISILLAAVVVVNAGKHHRKHQKSDVSQFPGGLQPPEFPGVPGLPGAPGGEGPGGPGGPENPEEPEEPSVPSGGDNPLGEDNGPSGAERKSLSRRLRASLEEARRESQLHQH